MTLKVSQHDIGNIAVDSMVYLLIRKADSA